MSIYIFVGPTLPVSVAATYLDAHYLPPVEQGDVLRLLPRGPKAIGIIDGRFQFVPSVWHKEILAAMAEGIPVFGAASMGALRAAELATFGMQGVGEVFEQYRSGALEDDDEVAVAHASEEYGYRETSDAMVNIRDVCRAAVREGVIPEARAQRFQEIAKRLYFPERSWARIFELAGDEAGDVQEFQRFRKTWMPVKRRDAIALLQRLKTVNRVHEPCFQLEETVFLHNLRGEVAATQEATEDAKVARKKVLLELLALEDSRRAGALDERAISGMGEWYRGQCGLGNDDEFQAFQRRTGLGDEPFRQVMERFAAVASAQARYGEAIDAALPGHLAAMAGRNATEWTQWNVAVAREKSTAAESALAVLQKVDAALADLRGAGVLRQFYFMRKAPDIRLRFRGRVTEVDAVIRQMLMEAREAGWVTSFHQSVYEPECVLFGGGAGMDCVHAYFDADTRVWLTQRQLSSAYSAAVIQDLLVAALGSEQEAWETWAEMRQVDVPCRLPAPLPDELPVVFEEHAVANRELAQGLRELWLRGELTRGLRAILASVAMFHFNRYGIAGPMQAALAEARFSKAAGCT